MGRKGKTNESRSKSKSSSKGESKNKSSQKRNQESAGGSNRIAKVSLTPDEQTMILDVLSSLTTYEKKNTRKTNRLKRNDDDDDDDDDDSIDPNLNSSSNLNPASGFSVPILKRAPNDTPSKASKGCIYSQMNRFDQRGYMKKLVRDDRFRRRLDDRLEQQIRRDRYIENERLKLEQIALTDTPEAATVNERNETSPDCGTHVVLEEEEEGAEEFDNNDDEDVNDEDVDEDDDEDEEDDDNPEEEDAESDDPSYWKPPSRHSQRADTVDPSLPLPLSLTLSLGPKCVDPTLSATLSQKLDQYKASAETADMRATRESLPIFQSKDTILRMIDENQVTVISGETGSGKASI